MDNELEKIDIIRSRFDLSYEDARKALCDADGDVVGALISVEKTYPQTCAPDLLALGAEIADEVQKMLACGPVRKVRVKYGGKLVAEKTVAFTAAAALAVGLAALLVSKLIIEVDRD